MKKHQLALVGMTLLMGGCAQQASYRSPAVIETNTANAEANKFEKLTAEMTKSMLASEQIKALTRQSIPFIFVQTVSNKTIEHINVDSLKEIITTGLTRSGQFQFVEPSKIDAVRAQLNFQNEDAIVNQAKAIKFGKMIGANYMLYGEISSLLTAAKQQPKQKYKMTFRLMDLKSGLIEWTEEQHL